MLAVGGGEEEAAAAPAAVAVTVASSIGVCVAGSRQRRSTVAVGDEHCH